MEVDQVLKREAKKAVINLRKNAELLRQVSGHRDVYHPIPTEKAIHDGIARRWEELGGVLVRDPFTFEHARSVLQRILDHAQPSGENNEQFRDCCIWESVLGFSASRIKHFVTNDSAFYQSRDRTRGTAASLQSELGRSGSKVRIYPTIDGFLAAASHKTIDVLEKDVICDAIVEAVTPLAHEIVVAKTRAGRTGKYELGEASQLTIKGYATPKPSVVAVTFGVSFDLQMFEQTETEERRVNSTLRLDGSCSYNPSLHETSDVMVGRWTHSLKENRGSGWRSEGHLDPEFQNQLQQTRYI